MDQKTTRTQWTKSVDNYKHHIAAELDGGEVAAWTDLISEQLPRKGVLDILDIGTGPGFFSIILSKLGHNLTGIDVTPGMIDNARKNAQANHVSPKFLVMDCHETSFPDNSFDLIVSRNVTWTLYEPIRAYKEFLRILRPGGRLLVFDANWYMNFFDEETNTVLQRGMQQYLEQYGEFPRGFSMYKKEAYWMGLPLPGVRRPDWDRATCFKLGYENFYSQENIDDRAYVDKSRLLLYGCTPMFLFRADKPET